MGLLHTFSTALWKVDLGVKSSGNHIESVKKSQNPLINLEKVVEERSFYIDSVSYSKTKYKRAPSIEWIGKTNNAEQEYSTTLHSI